ncbi:inosine/xanthosine triphosphatase [Candidatus Woesearchaeota archaeon]|nr:inosine/xanthosine triphosphatase [Candidatus Woesearchaeota archaeon]
MNINIGTENPAKIQALKEIVQEYEQLSSALISSAKIDSGVNEQPLTLHQTMLGAQNRAKAAYQDCQFSVGIESGFLEAPLANGGLMEITVCALYDGKDVHYGFSSGFNCPKDIMDYVRQGKNLTEAANLAGYTSDPDLGKADGLVSILTRGRVNRKEYTKQALRMALIHVEKRMTKPPEDI